MTPLEASRFRGRSRCSFVASRVKLDRRWRSRSPRAPEHVGRDVVPGSDDARRPNGRFWVNRVALLHPRLLMYSAQARDLGQLLLVERPLLCACLLPFGDGCGRWGGDYLCGRQSRRSATLRPVRRSRGGLLLAAAVATADEKGYRTTNRQRPCR